MRRLLRLALALVALLVALGLTARVVLSAPLPLGSPSPEAEALTQRMISAVNGLAWEQTGAVRWTFAGQNQHLWDRTRSLARVSWGDVVVWVDLGKQVGRATVEGEPVTGRRAERLVKKAYAAWVNDSFWLNPVVKATDQGTSRWLVETSGDDAGLQGLMVSYSAGGLTPGDSYLWLLDANGRPAAWRMWVSVIPIGGVRGSWEGWTQLSTGAWVSTLHHLGPLDLTLTDVAGAATLAELEPGPDPFAPLFAP